MRPVSVSAIGWIVAGVLLLAAPAFAATPGVHLSWSRCFGEGLGTQNRSFACDTNAGTEVIVASFVPSESMSLVSGNELVIDVLSLDDPLPLWWQMKDIGTCRQNSLGFNVTANANDLVCVDWGQGQSAGGIGVYTSDGGTSLPPDLTSRHRRLKIAVAVPLANLAVLEPEIEYFSCNVTVNHAKTVGTGACTGCTGQVCLVINTVKVTTNTPGGSGDRLIATDGGPGSKITWQGTGVNCDLVPVKNATWGQVKALYR